VVSIFDTQDPSKNEPLFSEKICPGVLVVIILCAGCISLMGDCVSGYAEAVGSAQLHPYLPYLLTASGTRHFDEKALGLDSEESSEDDESIDRDRGQPSLCIFRLGKSANPT
jgi:hypothetical protein